jgi:hypothetical protein
VTHVTAINARWLLDCQRRARSDPARRTAPADRPPRHRRTTRLTSPHALRERRANARPKTGGASRPPGHSVLSANRARHVPATNGHRDDVAAGPPLPKAGAWRSQTERLSERRVSKTAVAVLAPRTAVACPASRIDARRSSDSNPGPSLTSRTMNLVVYITHVIEHCEHSEDPSVERQPDDPAAMALRHDVILETTPRDPRRDTRRSSRRRRSRTGHARDR